MALIVGSFVSQQQAEAALLRLRDAGLAEDETVLIANAAAAPTTAAEAGVAATTAGEARPAAEAVEARPPAAAVEAPGGEAPDGEPGLSGENQTEKEAEASVNSAALGAAVGTFVGGGLMGPLGLALGAVAGTGVGLTATLVGRGLSRDEAQRYESDVLAGRYLVAVESDDRKPEDVRALMEESGVAQVKVEA